MSAMRVRRRLTAAAVAVFLVIGISAGPVAADTSTPRDDNSAIAVNTKDGSSLFQLAFQVTWVTGDTVNATNTAVAYASCTNCTTVAIAIQIVLVVGSPSVFTPQNVAVAVNDQCNLCNTLAMAYQLVIQVSGPVRLTPEGLRQLHDIRKQLRELKEFALTIAQIHDQVLALEQQIEQVMTTQLVPAGQGKEQRAQGATTSTTGDGGGATSTSTTATSTTTTVRATSSTTSTSTTASTSSTSTSTPTTTTSAP
ncbi:MAG TPA: hypothetical protein VFA94_12435 [Acidimicrobiales bacterium]|nr:hypothetical protein [Acidimicrobiales bacterium]